jgi:hypothetical protein
MFLEYGKSVIFRILPCLAFVFDCAVAVTNIGEQEMIFDMSLVIGSKVLGDKHYICSENRKEELCKKVKSKKLTFVKIYLIHSFINHQCSYLYECFPHDSTTCLHRSSALRIWKMID